jgi:hypothetical protein
VASTLTKSGGFSMSVDSLETFHVTIFMAGIAAA